MNETDLPLDTTTRIAEIRQENRGGDVSYRDIEWLCSTVERLAAAMRHVVGDSPSGTAQPFQTYSGNVRVEWSCGHFGLFAKGDKAQSPICPWCRVARGPLKVTPG